MARKHRRSFTQSLKNILYVRAQGRCEICGKPLSRGWHADHKYPYSLGGLTSIENGQALCADCNLRKGASFPVDNITLRPAQERFLDAVKRKISQIESIIAAGREPSVKEKTLVAWLDPGSGKTLAYLNACNWLFRNYYINAVGVYTPRVNLCQQAELDWKDYSEMYEYPMMGEIHHKGNVTPLIDDEKQFGFASTYQSLVMDRAGIHRDFFESNVAALVLDEAQMLGFDSELSEGTQAAWKVSDLAEEARIIFLLTGTPYRQDGKPLLLATYTPYDEEDKSYLSFDVRGAYTEGVAEGYLRTFDAHFIDGYAIHTYLDTGETNELNLTEMDSGFYKVVEAPGYWEDVVDRTIESVGEFQQIDRRYCGLVACNRQIHANQIKTYIETKHPNVRVLIAVSDERLAHDNLRKFKLGGYDILITVAMAHVGYDHKWITVVTYLGSVRDENWLRQLFARGMRATFDANRNQFPDGQYVKVIVPDDKKMAKVVEKLRSESDEGIEKRKEMDYSSTSQSPLIQDADRVGLTEFAETTGVRAKGMDEKNDINSREEYESIETHRKKHGIVATATTALKGFLREYGVDPSKPESTAPNQSSTSRKSNYRRMMTDKEQRTQLRTLITQIVRSANRSLHTAGFIDDEKKDWYCWKILKDRYGAMDDSKTVTELQEILRYCNNELARTVEQKTGKPVKRVKYDG
jgi:superfamily II DNA or RNA helicase/ribulose bisphosphate carboxylase small subunit